MDKKIYADLQKARLKNEYRLSTVKGVKNLSRSDLDTIELYAETIEKNGHYEQILMEPRNGVKEVLQKYKYIID